MRKKLAPLARALADRLAVSRVQEEQRLSRPRCLCDHHAFLDLVKPDSHVLDLGAFKGEFSREIAELTGSRVVAVEANPTLVAAMPAVEGVKLLNLAVADREGHLRLFIGSNLLGTSVYASHPYASDETVDVPATTLASVIAQHCGGRVDLLKVNIEGAEIRMLRSTDDSVLQGIAQITIQFHDFIPELDQAADVVEAKRRLRELGFGEILFKSPNKDVLFVNLAAGVMPRARFSAERTLVKLRQYARAAQKKLKRARA